MLSPHNGAEDSLLALMGKRNPMTPRLDEPQVNLPHQSHHHHHGHYGKNDRSSSVPRKSSSGNNKHKPSSSAAKKKSSGKKQENFQDLLDEASKEAQIVQKIEMAIKKSRSERRASSRSHSRSSSSSRRKSGSHGSAEQPSDEHRHNSEGLDENYQMIRTKRMEDEPKKHRRSRSKGAPHRQHLHKPRNSLEPQRYSNKNLIDLDERMELISQMDGLVDDKRGFQVRIDQQAWVNNTFSDPTLDTVEKKHFLGETSKLLDPQRIQCGPGRDQAVISRTDSSMKEENKEPDPTKSIIDRIYEKKHKKTEGKNNGMHPNQIGSSNHKIAKTLAQKAATAAAAQQMPSELISFDNYEDDDGYYYEDEDDDYPIFPPSRPPQPRPATKKDKDKKAKKIPITPLDYSDMMKDGKSIGGDTAAILQAQLEEINKLHRDIKLHQDRMKHISAKNNTRDRDRLLNPREYSSAEVYQRELARQAQAELYRLELVQKSMMLEKQMEIYRRNLDEWNRVRDLAIKDEEERRKITEKAKKVWQEEMRTKLTTDSNESSDKAGYKGGKTTKELPKPSSSNSQDVSSSSSGLPHEPSLYEKVAALNNRAVLTAEEQKIIEAEILNQLHMELSKQAAEKKVMQKPMFFSEKLRSSWSGKNSNDSGKPVEQITEELTHRIYELNLQMAASKHCKMQPMRMPNVKGLLKGVKSKQKSRFPRPVLNKHESDSEEDDEEDNGLETDCDENARPVYRKKKKSLLKTLGLRKTKHKTPKDTISKMRSAEVNVEKSRPKLPTRKDRNTISMPPPTPTSPAPVLSVSTSEHDDDDDEEEDFGAGIDGVLFHQEDEEEEPSRRRRRPDQPTSPLPGTPSRASKVAGATSSVSTQLTSNKVYIGVDIDGEAIEAMSVSSRNKQYSPSSSSDKSSGSKDRYTTCSGDVAVGTHSNKIEAKMHPIKKKSVDDPSIYEFLEVQYYPHGLDDEDEAPLDEMEADAYRGH